MKIYIKPELANTKILHEKDLLAASPGVNTGDNLGDEWDEGDVTYSKDVDSSILWDEDD